MVVAAIKRKYQGYGPMDTARTGVFPAIFLAILGNSGRSRTKFCGVASPHHRAS